MKLSFIFIALIALSVGSCAKKAVTRVTINVPETFSGHISLSPCVPGAKEPIVVDDMNQGATSACPTGDVEIEVHKGTKTFVIVPENVKVRKSASGEPRAITFVVP